MIKSSKDTIQNNEIPSSIVRYDDTDHIGIFCGKCDSIMDVTDIYRDKQEVQFFLICPKCGNSSKRKIYLKSEVQDNLAITLRLYAKYCNKVGVDVNEI